MRNGLNIANMSEFVSEIKEDPKEAQLYYSVNSSAWHDSARVVNVQTLVGGTTRVARDFQIRFGDLSASSAQWPLADEYAVAALGTCALVTFLFGASARAITLDSIKVTLQAEFEVRQGISSRLSSLSYAINADCDGADSDLKEICQMVSTSSPNHRVFVEANEVVVDLICKDGTEQIVYSSAFFEGLRDMSSEDGSHQHSPKAVKKINATVEWLYGTQYQGKTSSQSLGRSHLALHAFTIDQPKQYLGFDYGPNPQEYLIASLLEEVLENLNADLVEDSNNAVTEAGAAGHVDLRGITHADESVPPKMDQIKLRIVSHRHSLADLVERVHSSFAHSHVARLIIERNSIGVSLGAKGEILSRFTSSDEGILE